jgi:hypothetical protein
MDLSIIIVNWNSVGYLQNCLERIRENTQGLQYEIIIVDNASYDGSKEMISEKYPNVKFIQSNVNLGFAGGNNLGYQYSTGRNLLFLNPDTEVMGPALLTMLSHLESSTGAGAVGGRLLNSDKSLQTSCIQAFPTILNQALNAEFLRLKYPKLSFWGIKPLSFNEGPPAEVDAVSGAALMIKRSVFVRIGMFSSDYFMYSEDVDLCFKVNKAGWKTYYVSAAVIIHHGGTSSSQTTVNAFSSVMMLESRWRFFRKTRSFWYCWLYRLTMLLASTVRIGLVVLGWPIYRLRGRGSSIGNVIKKWAARLRWTLGCERWVKNYY